jgi:hypothetical protein
MTKEAVTIFGLKELPRPKGTGYLYVSYDGEHEGLPIAYFDFYKTSDEEHRAIFLDALSKLPDCGVLRQYELVNFNTFTEVIFREVVAKITGV